MDGMPHPDAEALQLRTLLLTDLCDSTGLVEKLGDSAAAQLFRDHDRLVLELQQRWRGRLIDRSDGLLLLFERPLDGLGFALDYRRSLEALGQAHRIEPPLMARAGLHVGEVLVWRNSDEAVSATTRYWPSARPSQRCAACRVAANSRVTAAKSWKSMATYQTPADRAPAPTMSCNSNAFASSCEKVGWSGTEWWSIQGRTRADTSTASTSATA